jgi:hypothetical protein
MVRSQVALRFPSEADVIVEIEGVEPRLDIFAALAVLPDTPPGGGVPRVTTKWSKDPTCDNIGLGGHIGRNRAHVMRCIENPGGAVQFVDATARRG